ncbi:hypothetical protein ACFRR7_18050 [Streptomyces sp. NPDC056909]|uniref:hypothetical protein n=1 Tax=Streptomyces sp. NPDC056909 TaxID=3345963 RepID=UPI00369FCFD3
MSWGHRGPSVSSLLVECRRLAGERLLQTIGAAFGPAGPGVPMECLAVRGTPGSALVKMASGPDDLLVVAAGARGRLLSRWGFSDSARSFAHHWTRDSTCTGAQPRPCRKPAGSRILKVGRKRTRW